MVELEKNKLIIRDKVVNQIFDNVYKVLVTELQNPDIKPGVTFEEQKIVLGRLDDLFLQQKMELYNTYFFDENIKPEKISPIPNPYCKLYSRSNDGLSFAFRISSCV